MPKQPSNTSYDSAPLPSGHDDSAAYRSPLSGRYASARMQRIWSEQHKFGLWRRIWLAMAEAQRDLGLPITQDQIAALRRAVTVTSADLQRASEHERRLRHDVMAHVHAYGDAAPEARGVIHLGATSQDINCNTEIPLLREALDLVCVKLARLLDALGAFAQRYRATPCVGFTHYQAAQPTTVGKRAAMWGSELSLCLERLEHTRDSLRLRGVKGATGTQASFLGLFDGDAAKVDALERAVAKALGWSESQTLIATGQTYPRVVDAFILSDLACVAASTHKMAGDIRLLCNHKELDEPFETHQIGSSAMPYKRNPMRCERACGLCRFVMTLAASGFDTASTQWLERTLDDSSVRRLALPESFLALDGALDLAHNVVSGLVVHEGAVRRNLEAEMPFLASERLMLAATKLGRDRQETHEAIRRHSQEAARAVKEDGLGNDLLERLRAEPLLRGVDFDGALDPAGHIGLAPRQVDRWLAEVVEPARRTYASKWASLEESAPQV